MDGMSIYPVSVANTNGSETLGSRRGGGTDAKETSSNADEAGEKSNG